MLPNNSLTQMDLSLSPGLPFWPQGSGHSSLRSSQSWSCRWESHLRLAKARWFQYTILIKGRDGSTIGDNDNINSNVNKETNDTENEDETNDGAVITFPTVAMVVKQNLIPAAPT